MRPMQRCHDARDLASCTLTSQAVQWKAASDAQCMAAGALQSSQQQPTPPPWG